MEQINTEEIMQEIQAQIQQRGYVRNELKFEDVQVETGTGEVHEQIDDYFELDQFGVTVDHMIMELQQQVEALEEKCRRLEEKCGE